MSKVDEFKLFIKNNPSFAKSILDKKYTYQQLFETYDMYGEESEIWDSLRNETKTSSFNMKSIINSLKGINTENLESNIGTVQKAVDLLEDITGFRTDNKEKESKPAKYKDIDKFYSD